MYTLKDQDLKSMHDNFLLSIKSCSTFVQAAFNDMAFTGCRWIEIYYIKKWQFISEDHVLLTPAKSGNERVFSKSDLSDTLMSMIGNGVEYNNYFRYHKAAKIFNRYIKFPDMFNGNKEVATHFFRYWYARRLKNQGFKDSEIKDLMGEVEQKNADLYIYSRISTNMQV